VFFVEFLQESDNLICNAISSISEHLLAGPSGEGGRSWSIFTDACSRY
jgi:hypothetical protein